MMTGDCRFAGTASPSVLKPLLKRAGEVRQNDRTPAGGHCLERPEQPRVLRVVVRPLRLVHVLQPAAPS